MYFHSLTSALCLASALLKTLLHCTPLVNVNAQACSDQCGISLEVVCWFGDTALPSLLFVWSFLCLVSSVHNAKSIHKKVTRSSLSICGYSSCRISCCIISIITFSLSLKFGTPTFLHPPPISCLVIWLSNNIWLEFKYPMTQMWSSLVRTAALLYQNVKTIMLRTYKTANALIKRPEHTTNDLRY